MKDILKKMYYGNLNESERPLKGLYQSEEFKKMNECYEKLMKSLTKEQKDLFEEYYESNLGVECMEKECLYENAVKTGICIGLEMMDFEP